MANPKITWGTSYGSTLLFAWPLDNVVAYSEPRKGAAYAVAASGARDAWLPGTDYVLAGDVRWIPKGSGTNPHGWDGSTGWRAFLEWARAMNAFRFYPDSGVATYYDCYLRAPLEGEPRIEQATGERSFRLEIIGTESESDAFDGF